MNAQSPRWSARLAPYRIPDNRRAMLEIAITLIPFIVLWGAMWHLLQISYWLSLLLVIPAAGLLLRLFMIQHDCGHGALFAGKAVNDWVGRALGVLTLTPYDYWRESHAHHHASSGNLEHRGFGDIDTLTVKEYLALSKWGRLKYRLYRHPLVMFGLGPAYLFILQHRFPVGAIGKRTGPWVSIMATNAAIAIAAIALFIFLGPYDFLLIHIPLVLIAASAGVWLFYVQHQFEHTHWSHHAEWKHDEAALHGSSYYDLPPFLMWITGNIGIHHLHHLSSRIPFHRLPQVLKDHPELQQIGRMTFWQSLSCVRLKLWDEERKLLVSFRELKRQMSQQPLAAG